MLNSVDDVFIDLESYRRSLSTLPSFTIKHIYDLFPLHQILAHYQAVGKHFVDRTILEELAKIKSIFSGYVDKNDKTDFLYHFIGMALDKYEEHYDYNTYIGTGLLNDLAIDPSLPFDQYLSTRISHLIFLLCDTGLFECQTFLGTDRRLPAYLTSPQSREKRILNILRGICIYGELTNQLALPEEIAASIKPFIDHEKIDIEHLATLSRLFAHIREQVPEPLPTICAITMQPVWTVHDEYLFIRILQCFEIIFSIVVKGFLSCQDLIQQRDFQRGASIINTLSALFQHNAALFRILTSMPRETFSLFRVYTDGASAIQSEQYKLIEILATRPAPERLQSAAFTSVPLVKKRYEAGEIVSFEELLQFRVNRENADFMALIQSMGQFDAAFVQWKKIHTNIAVKMLGSQPGTGYTLGTPYLQKYAERRLFPFLEQWENHSR